jgi:signal-transduction protein with cAMP-binding, CBS, and nucleotidyltransferase domain
MSVVDSILALRRLPLFEHLDDVEIGLVARACRLREFAPGEPVAAGGHPLRHLHVLIDGSVECAGIALPHVFGETSLLLGHLPRATLLAGPAGARCLLLGRSHFFTLVNECPQLLAGTLERLSTDGLVEVGVQAEARR